LQALQEHQAALLTLQQKAQDQLKEARAAQVNIVMLLYHKPFSCHVVSMFITTVLIIMYKAVLLKLLFVCSFYIKLYGTLNSSCLLCTSVMNISSIERTLEASDKMIQYQSF
jgi:hypothetical protein